MPIPINLLSSFAQMTVFALLFIEQNMIYDKKLHAQLKLLNKFK